MSDLIQFPFTRISYPSIDNPVYSQDIVAANQEIQSAIAALAGLDSTVSFAILGGLDYTIPISGPNYYTTGFFWLNGVIYYQNVDFDENLYLIADVTQIMPYTFSDAVTRNLYQVNLSQTSGSPTSATPQFSENMNQYRISNEYLSTAIQILQVQGALQNVQVPVLGSTYTVNFTNDKAIFFTSATTNTVISFDFTNAIPGTVVTLKWTFGGSESLSIPPAAGQTIYIESGDQAEVGNNVNLLTILYAGVNEVGNNEVRLVLSQPIIPT